MFAPLRLNSQLAVDQFALVASAMDYCMSPLTILRQMLRLYSEVNCLYIFAK